VAAQRTDEGAVRIFRSPKEQLGSEPERASVGSQASGEDMLTARSIRCARQEASGSYILREEDAPVPHATEFSAEPTRQPGVISLRIVVVLLFLSAAGSTVDIAQVIATGRVPLIAPLLTVCYLIAAIGLLRRSHVGRLVALFVVWPSAAISVFSLLAVLAALFSPQTRSEAEAYSNVLWFLIVFSIVRIAGHAWVLWVLHSQETIALMKESVSPHARPRR